MQEHVKKNERTKRAAPMARPEASARITLGALVREGIWVSAGWLLGQAELAFGTFPLGLGLLCASGQHTLPILLGLLGAGWMYMDAPAVYIVTYLVAAIVRLAAGFLLEGSESRSVKRELRERLFSKIHSAQDSAARTREEFLRGQAMLGEKGVLRSLFSESLCLRMASAAVCSFILSFYRILVGGFLYYDFFAALFSVLVTPAAVLVYSLCLDGQIRQKLLWRISLTVLLFSLAYAANSVLLLGLPFAPVLVLLFTLCATEREGTAFGATVALVSGIAENPMHAPAYLLAALLYGILKTGEKKGAKAPLACIASLSWFLYVDGIDALLILFPCCLLAATAFSLALRLKLVQERTVLQPDSAKETRNRLENTRYHDSSDRFRGISEAFSSLSEVFYNLSDRFRRPGTLDLRRICDRSFDRFCTDCPNKTLCWGLEYSETLGTVNRLTSALHTKGRVGRAQISPALTNRCELMPEILESINRECARLTAEMLGNNRSEIFAMDYEAAANIINDALREDGCEYRFDPEQEQKIAEYLRDAGVRAKSVTVWGNRRRQIVVRDVAVDHARVTVDTLCSDLGELCGMLLERPVFELENGTCTMTMRAKKRFSVTGAQNNLSADGGVSGDCVNLFSNKKDFFYALISDGMGAGREAALTSNLCSVFLEKMLRAGNRASTSLRMLNNLLRSRTSDSTHECSATVDLLELDLMTGEGRFIKSGAAPSFVIRGGTVHRLQSGSAPIGIICSLDAPNTPYRLQAKDTVVMVSDGIVGSDADMRALTEYLETVGESSPEEIVYSICMRAAQLGKRDDCSAIALRIENTRE